MSTSLFKNYRVIYLFFVSLTLVSFHSKGSNYPCRQVRNPANEHANLQQIVVNARALTTISNDTFITTTSQPSDSGKVSGSVDSVSNYVEAAFPGGTTGWLRYMVQSFHFPQDSYTTNVEGTVVINFRIDEKGRVKNAEAISGPQEIRKQAVRLIKDSGKWIPARLNGNPVPSIKQQSITFKYH